MVVCVCGKRSKIKWMAHKTAQNGEPEDAFP